MSLLAATKVQLQYDERSQVWGYKVPSKPDLSTVREQQGNANNRRHQNNSVTATIGHSAQQCTVRPSSESQQRAAHESTRTMGPEAGRKIKRESL